MKTVISALTAALLLAATAASAHHNVNAQFDNAKELQIVGTLSEIRDVAPHAQWKAMVVDPKTKVQSTFNFETQGANTLRRFGLSMKTDVKVGRTYTFVYSPARDGSNNGFMTALIIDGKRYQIVTL